MKLYFYPFFISLFVVAFEGAQCAEQAERDEYHLEGSLPNLDLPELESGMPRRGGGLRLPPRMRRTNLDHQIFNEDFFRNIGILTPASGISFVEVPPQISTAENDENSPIRPNHRYKAKKRRSINTLQANSDLTNEAATDKDFFVLTPQKMISEGKAKYEESLRNKLEEIYSLSVSSKIFNTYIILEQFFLELEDEDYGEAELSREEMENALEPFNEPLLDKKITVFLKQMDKLTQALKTDAFLNYSTFENLKRW